MTVVCVEQDGIFYVLDKMLNEVDEDAYIRLWYIINNGLDIKDPLAINRSIIYLNKEVYGMGYTPELS